MTARAARGRTFNTRTLAPGPIVAVSASLSVRGARWRWNCCATGWPVADRETLFECPDCRAQQPEPGACGRCPGVTREVRTVPALEHVVSKYDAQREGMALVAGWQVQAQVTGITGRKFMPIAVAICPDREIADEIAEFLNAKYRAAANA